MTKINVLLKIAKQVGSNRLGPWKKNSVFSYRERRTSIEISHFESISRILRPTEFQCRIAANSFIHHY